VAVLEDVLSMPGNEEKAAHYKYDEKAKDLILGREMVTGD
jgi:hypothetical protein